MLRTVLAMVLALVPVMALGDTLTEAERAEVRDLIRQHLIENPEVLAEAFEALQARQQSAEAEARAEALSELGDVLRRTDGDPIGGNPDGTVTVVEFFDYNCPFCRQVKPEVAEVLRNDAGIRYVFKEFPILSASSAQAARVALAVWHLAPERYWDVHTALMGHDGTLTEDQIHAAVTDAGLDWQEVVARGDADDVTATIRRNLEIAQRLQINGTPTFVIGERIIPGFVEADELAAAVAAVGG